MRCKCSQCLEIIQSDYIYSIINEEYCEDCKDDLFLDCFDNYPENPNCDICGKELDDTFYNIHGDMYCDDCFNEEFREGNTF